MVRSFSGWLGWDFALPAHPELISVKSSQPVCNASSVDQPDVSHRTTSSKVRFPERSVLSSRSLLQSDNPLIERLPDGITPDTPLRLRDAVRFGFPAGGMTISGLRREIERGRLSAELIAGKQFTTLSSIKKMREKCRVLARAHDFGDALLSQGVKPYGSSRTEESVSPQDALRDRLKFIRQKRRSNS